MALIITTPPTGGLITLDEAKAQCRVDDADSDTLLEGIILAASDQVQAMVQRRYLSQTIVWKLEHWSERMVLPVAAITPDRITISQVQYTDWNGDLQTLDPSFYWDRAVGHTHAVVKRWFTVYPVLGDGQDRVTVTFNITGLVADVPPVAKHATRMLVSHYYENRDAVVGVENRDSSTEIPFGVKELLLSEEWAQV